MCKKMLRGLFGGGDPPPPPPARAEKSYDGGKEAEVLGTVAGTAGGASVDTSKPTLSGGLKDQRRKKQGVPGLGL